MMVGMLVAGTGLVLAGLLAIGYGITINEFSTGNTLIVSGVTGFCTGAIMLGLWVAVRELRNIARQLGAGAFQARGEAKVRPVLPPGISPEAGSGDGLVPFKLETAESAGGEPAAPAAAAPSPPPWQGEAATRERPRGDLPPESEPAEAAPKRERSASARRQGPASRCRRIFCRRTFALIRRPHRRRQSPPKRNRHRSTMPGRSRSDRGLARPRRRVARAGHPRHSTNQTAPRRVVTNSRP
jgi:hypothetical protein